jgi:hypothetical protein
MSPPAAMFLPMISAPPTSPVRTLASIRPGERLQIVGIVFDSVRSRCAQARIGETSVVTCLAATATHVLLQSPTGEHVVFERTWSRFIQVDDPAAPRRSSAESWCAWSSTDGRASAAAGPYRDTPRRSTSSV